MPKKIIAVIGATGAQGSGLVRAIQNDRSGEFNARAVTRNVKSDKSNELAKLGAEVVAADIDAVESLIRACEGAHAAYCATFYWSHMSPDREKVQAKNM